jgi:UDP-glucose 4-epimerase
MDTVLVTGGLGSSGRWVVARLAETYDRVVCVDRDHPGFDAQGRDGIEFRAADLTDAGETLDLVTSESPDAVVHWAAIPVAGRHAGVHLYENNTLATHHVLTAAGRVGADVVQASSDGAYGFFGMAETPVPEELPITESHPLRPEDPYGLSKVVAEEVAETVVRRDGIRVVSLRPSWIQFPGDYACRDPGYVENRDAGAGNYWSYVDVRDVAEEVVAALATDTTGHEAVNCMAADNALGEPIADLVESYYGNLPAGVDVFGDDSAFSMRKAHDLLGFEPRHSWREAAAEAVEPPSLTV